MSLFQEQVVVGQLQPYTQVILDPSLLRQTFSKITETIERAEDTPFFLMKPSKNFSFSIRIKESVSKRINLATQAQGREIEAFDPSTSGLQPRQLMPVAGTSFAPSALQGEAPRPLF